MLEQIILGIVQGIVEWLPVSSEGVILLVIKNFFDAELGAEAIIRQALFLHLGTFLAALVYFRKDVAQLFKALFNYKSASLETKKVFNFLLATTLISGLLGFVLIKAFIELEEQLFLSAKVITAAVGLLLLVTGWLQIKAQNSGRKSTWKPGFQARLETRFPSRFPSAILRFYLEPAGDKQKQAYGRGNYFGG